jgi:hypothetical protein
MASRHIAGSKVRTVRTGRAVRTAGPRQKVPLQAAIPLDQEVRSGLPTGEAAVHLNRSPQTLRLWACFETGPIRPLRVNGRLAWPVTEIRRVLGVA